MGKNKNFDLFPIAMKVSAKTIGLDLVEVKPMSAPKMNLFYMNTVFDSKSTIRKNKINNIFNKPTDRVL